MKNKLCMLLLASGIGLFSCAEQDLPKEYTDSVNVFIGTGGHGHTFPGATLPHGMVQLSPDTRLFGWDACSGYYYDDTSIMGFTHTHLSGTGIGDYGDILFMPVVGEKPLIAGTAENPDEGYRSRFSHEQESARPGYYQVLLQDDSTSAVDTATDARIREAFAKEIPGTTKLIIAQRISSVQGADRIIVMNDGQVDGFGTHEELLANNQIYREVYESQTQGGGDFDEKGGA